MNAGFFKIVGTIGMVILPKGLLSEIKKGDVTTSTDALSSAMSRNTFKLVWAVSLSSCEIGSM